MPVYISRPPAAFVLLLAALTCLHPFASNAQPFPPTLAGAIESGDLDQAKSLLAQGADPNTKTYRGEPVLHAAASHGSLPLVNLLLEKGADVKATDVHGESALHAAAAGGSAAIVRALLANRADPNYADQQGVTPLGAAINGHLPEVASMLLKAGADINKPTADPRGSGLRAPALAWAIGAKDAAWTRFLLDHHADVNASGGSALPVALRNRDMSLIKELLDRHAKLNGLTGWGQRYGQECMVPINYLSAEGGRFKRMDPEVLELLLAHGAWINALNADGVDALFEAAQLKDPAGLKVLLRHGADSNSRNPKGVTALMIAADYRNVENVRLLLEAGADVEVRDSARETAFSHAAASLTGSFWLDSNLEICKLLLDRGAVVNNVDIDGRTPLILAVIAKDVTAVTYVLQHGANRAIRDYPGRQIYSGKIIVSGKTALEYAIEMKRTEIIALLQ